MQGQAEQGEALHPCLSPPGLTPTSPGPSGPLSANLASLPASRSPRPVTCLHSPYLGARSGQPKLGGAGALMRLGPPPSPLAILAYIRGSI